MAIPETVTGPFIETRVLVREYHVGPSAVRALAGIDLEVAPGEFLAVLGVSGSGKSTLWRYALAFGLRLNEGGLELEETAAAEVEGLLAEFDHLRRVTAADVPAVPRLV